MHQDVQDTPDGYRFPAESPAGRYWLAHGRGFTLCRDGRKLGVVEEVLVDPLRQRTRSVTIRRSGFGRFRRRETIEASRLEAVVPSARLLFVSAPPADGRSPARERTRAHATTLGARAAASSQRGAAALRPAGRGLLHVLVAAGAMISLLVGRAAGAVHRWALAAERWLRRETPRARARFVAGATEAGLIARAVATTLARATWTGLLHLRAFAAAVGGLLRELAAELMLLAAAGWRRLLYPEGAARDSGEHGALHEGDGATWRADADAPLGREVARAGTAEAPEETPSGIVPDAGPGR